MGSLLTTRQAEELHKSIIAYLTAQGFLETALSLRKEGALSEKDFDVTAVKKYESLLEKKWTSNVRLQKKILELETQNARLISEFDNLTPTSLCVRNSDPHSWLPQHPRYTLRSHRDTINCIAFHPRYSSLASGSDDCTVKVWDWEHGELEKTLKGHTRAVRGLDYGCPTGAPFLASCSSDLTIKLWDPADGYRNIRTLQGHDHIVSVVRFIPNGSLLASASKDTEIRLWNVTNGFCIKTVRGHTSWVRDLCPSLDGKYLLSTGDDMTVRLWEISANEECKFILTGHDNFNECCAIAPFSTHQYLVPRAELKETQAIPRFVASGSRDKTIKIWDSRGGRCLMALVGHDNWVRAIAFHPGGKYLLSVSDDKTLRCWDLSQGGKCVKTLHDVHESFITCLKWAPEMSNANPTDMAHVVKGAHEAKSSRAKEDAPTSSMKIQCIIATGGVDQTIRIFAG